MRLGIVSDTHGHIVHTQAAIRMLQSLEVEAVIHCGDIGSEEVVDLFSEWPTYFVFGNCDSRREALRESIEASGNQCLGSFGEVTLEGTHIAVLHSDDRQRFREALQGGAYDLVCYGHTHVAAIDRHGDTLALNPGAVYRANPHSIALVELPALEATIVPL